MPAIPAIIIAGASIYAAHTAAKGNEKAAETQASSDDKALSQAKEIYDTQRGDQAPYRQSGYGALDALNYGLGLPAVARPPAGAAPPTGTATTPSDGTMPPGSVQAPIPGKSATGSIGFTRGRDLYQDRQLQSGAIVKVKAPNGLIYLVPQAKAAEAQQKGGQLV